MRAEPQLQPVEAAQAPRKRRPSAFLVPEAIKDLARRLRLLRGKRGGVVVYDPETVH